MVDTAFIEQRYDDTTLEEAYNSLQTLQHRRQPLSELNDQMDDSILYHLIDSADDRDEILEHPYENEITVEFEDYQELIDSIESALEDGSLDDRLTSTIEQHQRFKDGYSEPVDGETVSELNDEHDDITTSNSNAIMKRVLVLKFLPAAGAVGGAVAEPVLGVAGGLTGLGVGLYITIEQWSYGRGKELAVKDQIVEQSMDNIIHDRDDTTYLAVEDEMGHTGRPLSRESRETGRTEGTKTSSDGENDRDINEEVREFVSQFEDIDD
jgi:hypothetical protein